MNVLNGPGLPDGWRVVRLGDVAKIAFSPVDKKTVDGETTTRLCNYTDVFYNRRISPEMDFMVATATQTEIDRWVLKRGDVLFTKDSESPDEIGIPAYVTQDMTDVLCGYHLGLARPNKKMVEGAFLAEVLASPQSASEFGRIANGVTRFGLTLPGTQALPILLPPLEEQRGIAAVLDSIDEAIKREEAVVVATERLRDAMLHELLTRGIPGRHTEWQNVPGLGTIPACWEVARLGDVCSQPEYGAAAPARPYDPSLPRYVRITDLTEDGRLRPDDARSADPEEVIGFELKQGDLLFARSGATVGKTYMYRAVDGPCTFAGYLIRFQSDRDMADPRFLSLWTQSETYRKWVASMFRAGAQPNLNAAEYASMTIPLPPLPEQQAIAEMLDGVEASINASRMQTDNLKSLKASAAKALLTGKVRVRGR